MNAAVEQGLVTIPHADIAMSLWKEESGVGIDRMLAMIRKHIDEFVTPDVTTVKGRKEIAAFAYKIAQSKTALAEVGKSLADEAKAIPKKIDASRKKIADTLDSWRDEVRKPLDDWEAAEETRVKLHVDKVEWIVNARRIIDGTVCASLRETLAAVQAIEIGPHLEEFESEYARNKDAAVRALSVAIAAREKYDAEQIELAALRAQAAERAAKDREEAIRREAAEAAEKAATQRAQAERDAVFREQEAAGRREADLRFQAEQAERRAAENEARIRREAAEEADKIKREADAVAAQIAADTAAREADKAHRGRVNSAAVAAFVGGGLSHAEAIKAVVMIAKKQVQNVQISY